MPRFAANISMMFNEMPFMARFEAAAEAGFRGVEYLFPYAEESHKISSALADTGLVQALYNTDPGDFTAGERGFAAVPGAEQRFRADLDTALDYAARLKPQNIHIMAGIAKGPRARATFLENLAYACAQAPEQGFVIEPINHRDMPGYHLDNQEDARGIIGEIGADNLGLQLDLYHCQIMQGDVTERIRALAPVTRHVQVASVPERHEPDGGELNFAHLMRVLDETGYDGWVGCEYKPAGDTVEGLGWFDAYRRPTAARSPAAQTR